MYQAFAQQDKKMSVELQKYLDRLPRNPINN
jgi:hypothetical protein